MKIVKSESNEIDFQARVRKRALSWGPGFGVQIKVRSILSEFYINFDIP